MRIVDIKGLTVLFYSKFMSHIEIKELTALYPTYQALKSFLQSEEGGTFRVIDQDEEGGCCLIRYEKNTSNMSLPHSSWFRSVVWDTVQNRPLCIAPPKSSVSPFPYSSLKEATSHGIRFEELLDGVMINAYKRVGDETLYLATRSTLNASGHFYSSKPFRQLFVESVMETTIDDVSMLEGRIQTISRSLPSPDPSKGETSRFFSFLIQHTENRIVTPIKANVSFLVQSGIVYEDGRFEINSHPYELATMLMFSDVPSLSFTDPSMSWEQYIESQTSRSFEYQGFVAKDVDGNRWTVRLPNYNEVKSLRGNHASDLERMVHLFQKDKIADYLNHYPEDHVYVQFHQLLLRKLASQLYHEYVEVHVKRTKAWSECDKMVQPHLYGLHGLYMKQKKRMTMTSVTEYLRTIPWQRLTFLVRRMEDQYGLEQEE